MKKVEEKIIAPEFEPAEKEKENQIIVIYHKEKAKVKLGDCVKFGFGFYIGFKLARKLKNVIVEKYAKK